MPIKNNSGENHVIKNIFAYRKRTSGAIVKRTPALYSTHRIWLTQLEKEVFIADEEFCEWRFKNSRIWNIFNYCTRMSNGVAKRRAGLDSAYQIDVFTLWRNILMADEEILSWRFKNWKIVNIFNYYGSIRRDITKWTLWLDSYHQINLTKKFNRFLMTLGRCFSCKDMNYEEYFNLDWFSQVSPLSGEVCERD